VNLTFTSSKRARLPNLKVTPLVLIIIIFPSKYIFATPHYSIYIQRNIAIEKFNIMLKNVFAKAQIPYYLLAVG
jgi:hypothetical protein